jgi:uncharacterized protein
VIAVDTNILVYAHRADSEWHASAYAQVKALAEGNAAWAIPWPCVHEFFAVVTHVRIYAPPTPVDKALDQIDAWLESPRVVLLSESELHWENLRDMLRTARVTGPMVHDARIAALCKQHGVAQLWSADRDFSRFAGVRVHNPLMD